MVGLAEDAPLDEVGFGENVAPAWRKAFFGEVLPTVRDVGSWVGEIQLVNRVTGRKIDVHRSIFALHDHEGKLAGYGAVMRDITDAKASHAALAKSEARTSLRAREHDRQRFCPFAGLAFQLFEPAHADWSAESLALHTQAVLQGAFILAKAKGGATIAADSIDHLRRYVELLFKNSKRKGGQG